MVALGVAMRSWAVAVNPGEVSGDGLAYEAIAFSLDRGDGYSIKDRFPTAIFPPAYPFLLAGTFLLFGAGRAAVFQTQVVLGGLSVLLAGLAARRLLGRDYVILTSALFATYPAFVWLPRRFLSENLALPLILASLAAATFWIETRTRRWAALLGVLLGLGVLTRAAGVFFALTLLAFVATSAWRQREIRTATVVTVLVSMGTLMPWLIRNDRVFGQGPSLTTQAGLTLYSSYWPPEAHGKRIWGNVATTEDPEVRTAYAMGNEATASGQLTQATLARLLADPMRAVRLLPEKLLSCLVPLDWEIFPHPEGARSFNWAYAFLLVPAAWGAWTLWSQQAPFRWLIAVPFIAVLVQTIIFYGSPRFRLLGEPSLLLFATVGLRQCLSPFLDRANSRDC